MAKYNWTPGSTGRTILVRLADAASATGSGLTGVTAAMLAVKSIRVETDNDVVEATITMQALANLTAAWASGGWFECTSPGWYRFDIPDAVLAVGAWTAGISIADAGANNIAECPIEIQLDASPSSNAALEARVPAALTSGRMDVSIGALQSGIATTIATAVWAAVVGGSVSMGLVMKGLWAFLAGRVVGAATATPIYYSPADGTTPVLTGNTVTSDGNRLTSTLA